MRILALITDAFGGEGGIARFNTHFLSALSSMNGRTSIVALPRVARPIVEKLPSRVIWKKFPGGKWIYPLSSVATLSREKNIDWIFCGHIHLAPLAAILSKWTCIPFWLQLYGIEAWNQAARPIHWAVKKASLVTAISRYTRRRFLAWSGVSPEKVKTLPCSVDERFQPGPKPDHLLRRYGLMGKRILLTLSRLSASERYKGQERVLEILPELFQKHPDLVYVIAGEGDDRPRLEKLVEERRLKGLVRFIGHVKESELVDHYRMADLFVMPSKEEGFGIVFLEAARCGIPVVGGGNDGSFDALLEGKLGHVVDIGHSRKLLQAIEQALDSRGAYPKEVEHFSSGNFNRLVVALAEEVMSHAGNPK